MLDIKLFRENADLIKSDLKKRKETEKIKLVDEIIEKDEKYRKSLFSLQDLKNKKNTTSKEISKLKKEGKDAKDKLKEIKELPLKIANEAELVNKLKKELNELIRVIPNISHEKTPYGNDESENQEIKKEGKIKKFDFKIKSATKLGEKLGLDFDKSVNLAGKGFCLMKGDLALLNNALIRFAIDFMAKRDYELIQHPAFIKDKISKEVMTFDDSENMVYKVQDEDLKLIGTSEHSLMGMYSNSIIGEEELPLKMIAHSPCFRKEIGSHGIDERGLYRMHQFDKIEQAIICDPKDSWKFFDEILKNTEDLIKELEIPYRLLEICTGDLTIMKARSIDIEFWFPHKNDYGEAMSCSNLTDCQARNLNMKYGVQGAGKNGFPHTLNNTVIATPRAIIAILENFQNEDGSVNIPRVLQPYMLGKKKLIPKN